MLCESHVVLLRLRHNRRLAHRSEKHSIGRKAGWGIQWQPIVLPASAFVVAPCMDCMLCSLTTPPTHTSRERPRALTSPFHSLYSILDIYDEEQETSSVPKGLTLVVHLVNMLVGTLCLALVLARMGPLAMVQASSELCINVRYVDDESGRVHASSWRHAPRSTIVAGGEHGLAWQARSTSCCDRQQYLEDNDSCLFHEHTVVRTLLSLEIFSLELPVAGVPYDAWNRPAFPVEQT